MHIACVSYYLPPQDRIGAGIQMHYTANAYARHGHAVTMFSPYGPEERDTDALYDMVRVPVGKSNRIFRFARNLRRQDLSGFDLLHTAGDDYWLLGKPRPYHVRTFHGSCLAEARHITGARERLRMLLLGLAECAACTVADRKVCVSEDTRRYLPGVREVIPNGVDLSVFRPAGPAAKSPNPSILFVGTLDSRKRGRELVDIFSRQVRAAVPDAELWVVREEGALPVDGVRWFGRVSLERLVDLYQSAWAFCLPSSYEGFGVPYIEAMACGTAVVATPNAGALEVLEKGKHGLIADLPDLGNALVRVLTDADERAHLERAGLERAQDFSWDRIVAAYLGGVPPRHRRSRVGAAAHGASCSPMLSSKETAR
jgi:glycosyltransferase involved in cell wall biosynthesis